MRLTIDHLKLLLGSLLIVCLMGACGKSGEPSTKDGGASPFTPYTIADSAKVKALPSGLRLYMVEPGMGDFPMTGTRVLVDYQGRLADGTVFDDSYERGEPLAFTIGDGSVIVGMDEAVRNLRMGSKAVASLPPNIAYGDGKEKKLPPKIPANATLTFHLHVLGSF